jgi:4'-phosphopantetheinyl transferase
LAHDSQWLSGDERARAQRLRDPFKRQQFISSRSCLRHILARYLQISPVAIKLDYADQGKPYLNSCHGSSLCFNLAHSGDMAIIAVALETNVGVDLERIDPQINFMMIARRYFSSPDYELLCKTAPERRCRLFYRYWTRYEALGKLSGLGITAIDQSSSAFVRPVFFLRNYVCSLATSYRPDMIERFVFNNLC